MRDIPRAVGIAFDLHKLAMGALGLMAACLAYGVFHSLGAMTGERAAHRVFIGLGALIATCLCVLFSGLIARMTTTQLLEDRRAGAADLREFVRQRGNTLLGIPLAFGGLAALLLGIEAMITIVGAVPGIGPIVFSSSFLLVFLLSFGAVVTSLIHFVGAFLYPTIVAIRGVGAVGAMIEVIELARRKPLLLILYEAVAAAVGSLMTLLIGAVVWASLSLTTRGAESIMGEKYEQTLGSVPAFFGVFLRPFRKLLPMAVEDLDAAWHYDLSGILLGASLLVVVVLTIVYPFVFFNAAGSITYLILRTEPPAPERSPIEDL